MMTEEEEEEEEEGTAHAQHTSMLLMIELRAGFLFYTIIRSSLNIVLKLY